jgi:hypothetical protein
MKLCYVADHYQHFGRRTYCFNLLLLKMEQHIPMKLGTHLPGCMTSHPRRAMNVQMLISFKETLVSV